MQPSIGSSRNMQGRPSAPTSPNQQPSADWGADSTMQSVGTASSLSSTPASATAKGQADRSSTGNLQVRKIQMMVEQELAMSTSALHEQFRQQLEIERSDRQAALSDLRRDIEGVQTSLVNIQRTSSSVTPPGSISGSEKAIVEVRGQVASLRDDVRGALARQDASCGDFEQLRRDIDKIQASVMDMRAEATAAQASSMQANVSRLAEMHAGFEQQQMTLAQLREDMLALANRLVGVERGTSEAASAAAAAAMTQVDASSLLTAVRLEITEPLESQFKREVELIKKDALDRAEDLASLLEAETKDRRTSEEEMRSSIAVSKSTSQTSAGEDKMRLEELQSALEAEHEARRAAVDELRASMKEQWSTVARGAQTSNETSGKLRELSDQIALEKREREASIQSLQRRVTAAAPAPAPAPAPSAGAAAASVSNARLEELAQASRSSNARLEELAQASRSSNARLEELTQASRTSNARLEELAQAISREQQVRSTEIDDLRSSILKVSQEKAKAAALSATEYASRAPSELRNSSDSTRLRAELLEEVRQSLAELGGRVSAEQSDFRTEMLTRIESIESHLWRSKVDEILKEKLEEVLRLTLAVSAQTEKLQEQVLQEGTVRKAIENKLAARLASLERNVDLGKQQAFRGDGGSASVCSGEMMSAVTPTTQTGVTEEEPLENLDITMSASRQNEPFISSTLRSTLEELVDKVQKTLRPGSLDPAEANSEATPSERSHELRGPENDSSLTRSLAARGQTFPQRSPSATRGTSASNRRLSPGPRRTPQESIERNASSGITSSPLGQTHRGHNPDVSPGSGTSLLPNAANRSLSRDTAPVDRQLRSSMLAGKPGMAEEGDAGDQGLLQAVGAALNSGGNLKAGVNLRGMQAPSGGRAGSTPGVAAPHVSGGTQRTTSQESRGGQQSANSRFGAPGSRSPLNVGSLGSNSPVTLNQSSLVAPQPMSGLAGRPTVGVAPTGVRSPQSITPQSLSAAASRQGSRPLNFPPATR